MPEHTYYKCPPGCERPHCRYCEGNLAYCTVCKGAEGSLPTDCPGAAMTEAEGEAVYAGHLDWQDGKGWVWKALVADEDADAVECLQ